MGLGYKGRRSQDSDMTFGEDFKSDGSLLSQVMSKSKANLASDIPSGIQQLAKTEQKAQPQTTNMMREYTLPDGTIGHMPNSGGSNATGNFVPNAATQGKGFTIYDNGKYNSHTGLSGNKAYRNNNPGNISGMGGKLIYGASGFARNSHGDAGDRAQLVFNTPRQGWKAMNQLMSGDSYNNAPISQAFAKYQSNQTAWKNMQSAMVNHGIDPRRSTFNQLSPNQKIWFMNNRASHEGYTGAPVTYNTLYS